MLGTGISASATLSVVEHLLTRLQISDLAVERKDRQTLHALYSDTIHALFRAGYWPRFVDRLESIAKEALRLSIPEPLLLGTFRHDFKLWLSAYAAELHFHVPVKERIHNSQANFDRWLTCFNALAVSLKPMQTDIQLEFDQIRLSRHTEGCQSGFYLTLSALS